MPVGIGGMPLMLAGQQWAQGELNSKMAREQWDWQKKLYAQQLAAGKQTGGLLSSLINQYNTGYGEAKAANEARYQQMLGITNQTTGQRLADIRSDYGAKSADMLQNLARLGMANTTIAPTLTKGNERDMQAELNRAADTLQGTKLGIMERRTDEYPNANMLMSLISTLGQGATGLGALGNLQNLAGIKLG